MNTEQQEESLEVATWKPYGGAPVPDATAVEVRGSRGQRLRFFTQADLDAVYAGCAARGLTVVGVKGTRIYGSVTKGYVLDKDGKRDLAKGVQEAETGTARVLSPEGRWVGEEEIEAGYWVTVMAPRAVA